MLNKTSIIYLAAGLGSRLKKKTQKSPKCMVKVKNKLLIDFNMRFLKKFKKTYIISGYRSRNLKEKLKNEKFKICFNKKYNKTNMVYSAFIPNIKSGNVVICYGDIIFNSKIARIFFKNSGDFLPVYKNWFRLWKKRMPIKYIKKDAEDLVIKKNIVTSIGKKIVSKLPRYQFMGMINFKYKTYNKLKKFFKKNCKNNIDFTSILNLAINKKILKLRAIPTNYFWYEIDTPRDLKIVEKEI